MAVPFLPLVDNCVSVIDEVMAEIMRSTFPIFTDEIKESYETWRRTFLPYTNDLHDLENYAERIGETSPLFPMFESSVFPYAKPKRVDARVTSFDDEDFNAKYAVLHAVSIPSVGVAQARTRAFQVSSQVAADILTKIKGAPEIPSSEFKTFEDYISRNHKQFATFYEEQCKFSIHGSFKYVKASRVADTHKAVSSYLGDLISRLYTPLLKSFEEHVERVLEAKQPADVIAYFILEGTRHKLCASDLTLFGVKTINMLMYLLNMRESELFKVYASLKKPFVYKKVCFRCAEAIIDIFSDQKRGSLEAFKDYSKVIFPYRVKHANGKFTINLVIMIPQEKKLFFLDLVRGRDDARGSLHTIKNVFDRYYQETFTLELYSTIPEVRGVVDNFQRINLETVSIDEPIIYMFVAIYYVLFGCPLIFDATDISNKYFQDKIKYALLLKELLI
jgi:hypothetical protein